MFETTGFYGVIERMRYKTWIKKQHINLYEYHQHLYQGFWIIHLSHGKTRSIWTELEMFALKVEIDFSSGRNDLAF